MFSHVFVSVGHFETALRFYQPVMESLGIELRFCDFEKPWAGWHSEGQSRLYFVIGQPYDGGFHHPGNGQMIAFLGRSREHVRTVYQTAMRHGAQCEGPPGLRPVYHASYYGAYFRDRDGNKLCVACHVAESE